MSKDEVLKRTGRKISFAKETFSALWAYELVGVVSTPIVVVSKEIRVRLPELQIVWIAWNCITLSASAWKRLQKLSSSK